MTRNSAATGTPGGHLHFRPDIEGLRAVAIVLVVLYHAGWRLAEGGYLGVDVFFVLSGFLITGIIADEVAKTGRLSLTNFWARRARRLLPAAAVVTLAVLVLNAVLLSPFEQLTRARTAQAFAAYGSNILFAIRSTDYFGGQATHDPLLHTWSLSVEEQFYLFFAPLLLWLAVRTAPRGEQNTDSGHAANDGAALFRRRLGIATILLSVLSLAGCLVLAHRYPVIAFFSLPSRAWEFGLGALALLIVKRMVHARMLVLEVLAIVALAGLAASAILLGETRVRPLGISTLLPTLSTVALVLTGAGARQTLVARILSWSPIRFIGRLSYSWYLWHWPILVYYREAVPHPSMRMTMMVAMLSLIPAAVTYVLVESPIRFSAALQRRAKLTVSAAVALAAVTIGLGALAIVRSNMVLGSPRYTAILSATAQPSIYDNGCQVPLLASVSPPCRYGPGANDTTVVLFGDSHAAHWFPAFDSLAKMRGWTLVNLTKTGCPSVEVRLNNLGRRYVECEAWRTNAIERIRTLKPTLVVLSNMRSYNVVFGNLQPHTDSSGLARREWSEGLARTLTALQSSRAQLVVLGDTPQPAFDVPRCLVKFIDHPSRCDVPPTHALDPRMAGSEIAAVRAVPGTAYISLNSVMCDSHTCPVYRDGIVRYRDKDHLAVRYSASLAPELSRALTGVLQHRASFASVVGRPVASSASVEKR